MIIHEFPDIQWLRKQAENGFASRRDLYGNILPGEGWPSVVLNTATRHTERKDIRGPFSVFVNLKGSSRITSEGNSFKVNECTYAVTNEGQYYDLVIDDRTPTHTFNIHFGQSLYEGVSSTLTSHTQQLLDSPFQKQGGVMHVVPRIGWQDEYFKSWVSKLSDFYQSYQHVDSERENELLAGFMAFVLVRESKLYSKSDDFDAVKKATKNELLRRVLRALDYIHQTQSWSITLDELSQCSTLSRFHLLRVFKRFTGLTPQQYIAKLRYQKALALLREQKHTMTEVALITGFSELAAFTRFFTRMHGVSPSAISGK
ncbi:MAG: AraC family transcriptional regulator [Bacteroidota bacterium]